MAIAKREYKGKKVEEMGIQELIDHILEYHHVWVREEFSELTQLFDRLVEEDTNRHTHLKKLKDLFLELKEVVLPHLIHEEKLLFEPLANDEKDLSGVVSMVEAEHRDTGAITRQLRELSEEYTPPQGATKELIELYQRLARLEDDLRMHTYKEDEVLFPKILQEVCS